MAVTSVTEAVSKNPLGVHRCFLFGATCLTFTCHVSAPTAWSNVAPLIR